MGGWGSWGWGYGLLAVQEALEGFGCDGWGVQVALKFVALQFLDLAELFFGLDAFCHQSEVQQAAHLDDHLNNWPAFGVGDEGSIDLQSGHRIALEVAQV